MEALEQHFGHRKFLEGQERVVSAILAGRDTMAIMPTGGGKSLCYQLPALVMDGVAVVVSPLIALMKDQVDGLTTRGIAATMINSTLTPAEQRARMLELSEGRYKIVYIAPERFRQPAFVEALRSVDVSLFAVDEAHCLSQWGHDFRPDYLRLGEAVKMLGHPQVAAFTATATPIVRKDIMDTLELRDPFVSISGFERPNLSFSITQCEKKRQKFDRLAKIVREHKKGIVYCSTRKRVEEVADILHSQGVRVVGYHGGLDDKMREIAQNRFISKEVDVAVATNAFGMGIDRPDVRFVVHFDIPGSIEAYYQEAGRAGRDGEAAVCELLFNYADTRTQEFFIEGNNPSVATIHAVYEAIHRHADANGECRMTLREMADEANLPNDMGVSSAVSSLGRLGYLRRFEVPGSRMRGTRLLQPEVSAADLEIDAEAIEEKERRDREKLKAMIELCYAEECRQEWILAYFGEKEAQPCGNCDNCLNDRSVELRKPESKQEELIVQKALSGVARMSRKTNHGYEGRFGRSKIAGMLVGSRSQDVLNARLDELSTYGLLKECGQAYVLSLLRELQARGLLEKSPGEYPLVTLTPRGVDAMKGNANYKLAWPALMLPSKRQRTSGNDPVETPENLEGMEFDEALFEELRDKRNELAKAEGVPAYVIFSNQTLEFFARLKPTSEEAARKIRGVGEVKAERYLGEFLPVIQTAAE
ncbi:MAG: RecQ family ATP-dependent DNA helicase [Verrucomicrobiota bacterium]